MSPARKMLSTPCPLKPPCKLEVMAEKRCHDCPRPRCRIPLQQLGFIGFFIWRCQVWRRLAARHASSVRRCQVRRHPGGDACAICVPLISESAASRCQWRRKSRTDFAYLQRNQSGEHIFAANCHADARHVNCSCPSRPPSPTPASVPVVYDDSGGSSRRIACATLPGVLPRCNGSPYLKQSISTGLSNS